MPIQYDVHNHGHLVIAQTSGVVSSEEFIAYEISHAIDNRVQTPVDEILIVRHETLNNITRDDMERVLRSRCQIQQLPVPHRCAIVITHGDVHSWDLAQFYDGMVRLHSPASVIVFGEEGTARTWLGLESINNG